MTTPRPAGGPPPQVLQWLHRVIAPEYQDPQRTYSDVANTLANLPTLAPRTSVYTHENGKPELLVHLFGTLPVLFRGATYNIPISIWVPHSYPKQPPIPFVTPAKDMLIRPGNHVDLAGKCYHPYLANWVHYSDRSNIVDLCDVLRGVFGREPPVMAKQPEQQPAAPKEPPPLPPLPSELATKSSPPQTRQSLPVPPPVPPLPKELAAHEDARRYSVQSMPPPVPHQQPPPPPPPPKPPVAGRAGTPSQQYATPPMEYRGVPPPGSPQVQGRPMHHPQQPLPPPPPQPQHGSPPPPPKPQMFSSARPPSYQGYPPQYPQPQPPTPKPAPPNDLLDSPSPALTPLPLHPPPPPPNPEKSHLLARIGAALHTLAETSHSQTSSALSGASAQRTALQAALLQLEREAHELRHINGVCNSDAEILRERIAMAEAVIQDCRTRELPDVDAMVVAGSVVETQLYELVAEEMAIEDTIYVLSKALDRERITLEVFLKHARTLAREQFMKKALIQKISEELGIDSLFDHTRVQPM
ncbi:ESCRT-I component [Tricharina praecox]|uniref:ESCRT-I component n=1 Tax=Tricharina praecox TaxID=43433 RepID=UPI002220DC8B|nr:ESCRT-I component [Tricharina praecox]KAI5853932.1 ESCRT-I component [Tricharina praecox]